jgi:hypothetical protein
VSQRKNEITTEENFSSLAVFLNHLDFLNDVFSWLTQTFRITNCFKFLALAQDAQKNRKTETQKRETAFPQ